ncbi:hypothetical protein LJB98_06000 [Bacteroidales bacterium OttesenSCG-928-M11]|nr:hypothetical protein [Bacteroidales bacterium OttesenSCG-928-M11]
MEKGDIVWAMDKTKHYHPIVFLEKIDEYSFKACILSTKDVNGNLKMQSNFIRVNDENGCKYDFQYNDTYLVSIYSFVKMNDWIAGAKIVGKLSDDGIKFAEANTPNIPILCPIKIQEFVK